MTAKNFSLKLGALFLALGMVFLLFAPAFAQDVNIVITNRESKGQGTISPTVGQHPATIGDTFEITVTPDTGYQVKEVTVEGESISGTPSGGSMIYTFEVTGGGFGVGESVNVEFKEAGGASTITASVSETYNCGTIVPEGDVSVDYQTDQLFTITPNEGCVIYDVKVGDTSVMADLVDGSDTEKTYTFESVETDGTIEASFRSPYWTITTGIGDNGTLDPSGDDDGDGTGMVEVDQDGNQTFTITPADGFWIKDVMVGSASVLDTLTIDPTSGEASYTFEAVAMDDNIDVTFDTKYTVTATTDDNGTVSPEAASVANLNTATFTITPNTGFAIADVMLGDTSVLAEVVDNTYTTSEITSDQTLAVTFKAVHTITVTADGNGTVVPSDAVAVEAGEDQDLTITPDDGYVIFDVEVDGTSSMGSLVLDGVNGTYSFTGVDKDYTVNVIFRDRRDVNGNSQLCLSDVIIMLGAIASGEGTLTLADVIDILQIITDTPQG